MGFPAEIPNSFPDQPPVPVQEPISSFFRRIWERVSAPFRRRKRTAAHQPGQYHTGVDPRLPRIEPGDSVKLDFEVIEREVK